jgi:hypothetical protein
VAAASIGFRYVYSQHRTGSIALFLQFLLQRLQVLSRSALFDVFDPYSIYPGCTTIGPHHPPRRFQRVCPIDPVIERIKPKFRFLLGLLAQLPPQVREFFWDGYLPALFQPLQHISQFFRSGSFSVQAVLLLFRWMHASRKAPSLHQHYPASSLLWAFPTPAPASLFGYLFPQGPYSAAGLPGSSIALSTHAIPFHPGEPPGCFYSFLHRTHGLDHFRQTGRSHPFTLHEVGPGSLSLWLMSLSHEASPIGITPNCARLTTCATSNSHGELLSVHEIDQAYPGAPKKSK